MTSLATDIVDAITDDVLNLGLESFKHVRRYAEPLVYPPEKCPMLAVSCLTEDFRLLTGGKGFESYERMHTVKIQWIVWNDAGAETGGTGDPEAVLALRASVDLLIEHLVTYASGVPGLEMPGPDNQLVATLRSLAIESTESGAFKAEILMTVEEAG